jgi:hypothetical protein
MSYRLSLPVVLMSAVGLVTLGFLASCGGNQSSSSQSSAAAGTPADPTTTTQPPSASGEVRPGCGTYCQSAGGIGGDEGPGQPAVTIVSSGIVTVEADGYVPVTLTCDLRVQCRGALVLALMRGTDQGLANSKSDLVVDAGATATLGVRLSAEALGWLQSHGRAHFLVIADSGPSLGIDTVNSPPDTTVDGFSPLVLAQLDAIAPPAH